MCANDIRQFPALPSGERWYPLPVECLRDLIRQELQRVGSPMHIASFAKCVMFAWLCGGNRKCTVLYIIYITIILLINLWTGRRIRFTAKYIILCTFSADPHKTLRCWYMIFNWFWGVFSGFPLPDFFVDPIIPFPKDGRGREWLWISRGLSSPNSHPLVPQIRLSKIHSRLWF